MKLRCKPGDLAVILYDIPECADNIGRLVIVRGPVLYNTRYKLRCWLIKPVHPAPYWVDRYTGVSLERVTWRSQIEHPDPWMLPIRPEDLDQVREMATRDLDQFLANLNTVPAEPVSEREKEKVGR